ncbi:MAG: dienelactone hydrolase family protein [Nitrospira sp.]|nr:dienelactone hydrolase family protein [Nitrospira sp.]
MMTRPEHNVQIVYGKLALEGILGIPPSPSGVIIFAHGSGSGRLSPRNNFVARYLQQNGLATLLLDLLMPGEAEDRRNVFDIDLLADRLLAAKAWLKEEPGTEKLRIGYFGASTGAGAALQAAARDSSNVQAIVSRGGRPDLAEAYLPSVTAPTLLIVGGWDEPVIEINQSAYELLTCEKKLIIVPGATHLFEEPGTLEAVADHACKWFLHYLHGAENGKSCGGAIY